MTIRKAVITAGSPRQRTLPLQAIIDRDGTEKPVLRILIEEVLSSGIDEICVVASSGSIPEYSKATGLNSNVRFIEQQNPRGYGHALSCAARFVADDPFLHLVGDHLYINQGESSCANQLVAAARENACAVSAVQPTREHLVVRYGTIGGKRQGHSRTLYRIDKVVEKPTPTEAEQSLITPGMRAGHYLCFFGMHVFTPSIFPILERRLNIEPGSGLSEVLNELARQEQYLAMESSGRRFDIGERYGLLRAQLAVALNGRDRAEVLTHVLEVTALAAKDHDRSR